MLVATMTAGPMVKLCMTYSMSAWRKLSRNRRLAQTRAVVLENVLAYGVVVQRQIINERSPFVSFAFAGSANGALEG
jgi:hypothetical protein